MPMLPARYGEADAAGRSAMTFGVDEGFNVLQEFRKKIVARCSSGASTNVSPLERKTSGQLNVSGRPRGARQPEERIYLGATWLKLGC
jgi:hypothetical protein